VAEVVLPAEFVAVEVFLLPQPARRAANPASARRVSIDLRMPRILA
jgi:hypothetical protein